MRFIHCSDLHIDSPLLGLERYPGAPVDAMRASTRQAFDNIVEAAIEQKVDLVAIAGDVFDSTWRDFNAGLYFVSQLSKLREAKIRAAIVRGNHDSESEITKNLRMPDNVVVFDAKKPHTVVFEDIGMAVHGQSFANRAVPEDLAAEYPDARTGLFNLGLLHTSLGGYAAHQTYAPTTLDVLRGKGYQYWALGHVHVRQLLCEEPRIVFCGNSQGRNARETGAKGCELVTVEDTQISSEFLPIDVVRWHVLMLDIGGLADLDELLSAARQEIRKVCDSVGTRTVAMRVVLQGAGSLHTEIAADTEKLVSEIRAVATDASDGTAWIEKVQLDTRASYDRATIAQRNDAFGELLKLTSRLDGSPSELRTIAKEAFGPMLDKLPPEVRDELGKLDDTDQLRALLRDAEGSLLGLVGGK